MARTFKTAEYEATLDLQVSLREALPPDHLARFVVDLVAQLDFSPCYARYSSCGGQPYAPEILFALLLYGLLYGGLLQPQERAGDLGVAALPLPCRSLAA